MPQVQSIKAQIVMLLLTDYTPFSSRSTVETNYTLAQSVSHEAAPAFRLNPGLVDLFALVISRSVGNSPSEDRLHMDIIGHQVPDIPLSF
jgi:hypothetical protein